jgi:hypothetical protein
MNLICLCNPTIFNKEAYEITLLSVCSFNVFVTYEVAILSKESSQLVLPRTSCS